MMKEINRDYYCIADYLDGGDCFKPGNISIGPCSGEVCHHCHHKWPTPEQFKAEYGEEYPEDGAVYCFDKKGTWWLNTYNIAKEHIGASIICACTPWGKPPDNWKPE